MILIPCQLHFVLLKYFIPLFAVFADGAENMLNCFLNRLEDYMDTGEAPAVSVDNAPPEEPEPEEFQVQDTCSVSRSIRGPNIYQDTKH